MRRIYTEVNFIWCEQTNQYIETTSESYNYSGDMALCTAVTGQTDVGQMAGYSAGVTVAQAILQFNKANVLFPLITVGYASKGSVNVVFPEWGKVGVGSVTSNSAHAEGDFQDAVALTNAHNTTEVLRNNITANVTDLVAHGTTENALVQVGEVLGNAIATKFDNLGMAFFDGFNTSKGVNTEGLRFLDIMDAVASLEANDAPRPYSAVLHPSQVYGTFGLSNEFGISTVNTSNGAFNGGHAMSVGDQFMGAGFVTSIAGINFFTSSQVPAGGSGEVKGGIFAKTAIGVACIDTGGGSFIQIASEREETQASTVVTANGYFAFTELVDLHGVEIHTEIA